jgi:hypothetical protein
MWIACARTFLILFSAAPLIAAFPTQAGSTSGPAKTVILAPALIVNTAPLDFGNLIPVGAGNTIINAQTGIRSTTTVLPAGGAPSSAKFVATGTPNTVVTLSITPTPIVLTAGAASMNVNQLRVSINGGGPQPLGPNASTGPLGIINFAIGGRLIVAANQATGVYSGTFTVTMNYQ